MRSVLRISALLTLVVGLARPLAGQPLRAMNAFPGDGVAVSTDLAGWQTQAAPTKDPGLALILAVAPGFIGIHGAGSFYAQNPGHGWRHLAIGAASITAAMVAFLSCGVDCSGSTDTLGSVGMVIYLGNWVWSTIVAKNDVEAHNRALR